jgi:hypothetical protein
MEILDIGEDFKERYFNQAKLFSTIEVEFLINLYSELLKQLRWSENAKSYFKAAIIKSVNYKFIDEEQMDKRFKKIDSDLEEMKNNISKFSILNKQADVKPASIKKDENTISKVKTIEENIDRKDENFVDKEDIEIKKTTDSDDFEKSINDNWNIIVAKIKEKNVPLHAKFIEVKNFKIDNNVICFYLAYDKKWHKENLNKINNTSFVQDIIRDITGKNFKVIFETTDTDKEIKNTGKAVNSKEHTAENEDNIFDYIEEKFEIKEK